MLSPAVEIAWAEIDIYRLLSEGCVCPFFSLGGEQFLRFAEFFKMTKMICWPWRVGTTKKVEISKTNETDGREQTSMRRNGGVLGKAGRPALVTPVRGGDEKSGGFVSSNLLVCGLLRLGGPVIFNISYVVILHKAYVAQ